MMAASGDDDEFGGSAWELVKTGARCADVDALRRGRSTRRVMVWNYHDDDLAAGCWVQ